jgi:anthranilate synthase
VNPISQSTYTTAGGVRVAHQQQRCNGAHELAQRLPLLDSHRGLMLSTGVDYPGRYRRRDLLLLNPPVQICAREKELQIEALNTRGELLLHECLLALSSCPAHKALPADFTVSKISRQKLICEVPLSNNFFPEELRTRQPSVFSVLRSLTDHFKSPEDELLGLYGAFAYDLAFQFEAIRQSLKRPAQQRDMVLYLPDELLVVDPATGAGTIHRYDFVCRQAIDDAHSGDQGAVHNTGGLRRHGAAEPFQHQFNQAEAADPALHLLPDTRILCDHQAGEYAATVRRAKAHFSRGELFEAVPGQTFSSTCLKSPVAVFRQLQANNPAPYGALINLGQQEYLISASPEMFVRVTGERVETCPISGTIARGKNALEDADRIRELLNSDKDEAELSMCTDVDRNDKSRVCVPGSVNIIGRRQVELYSRLIHTVDHVEGKLLAGYDALDAFLTHAWAVTVTGAPKHRAMQFIEDNEKTARRWYGGAFGRLGFDGNMDTGLTIRTIQIEQGLARVRAGATLLQDSDPQAEELETRLKASALLEALQAEAVPLAEPQPTHPCQRQPGQGLRALMVDHQDSFVHMLASAFRATGMQLETLRPEAARQAISEQSYDLVILSPGPGRPQDFDCQATLALCEAKKLSVFGVCLGLQAMIEYAGGDLAPMSRPVHGRAGTVQHRGAKLFSGLRNPFRAGRYHSLRAGQIPQAITVTARSLEDDVVMAIEHRSLPWSAVQFHPESLMTLDQQAGQRLINNVVEAVVAARSASCAQLTLPELACRYH